MSEGEVYLEKMVKLENDLKHDLLIVGERIRVLKEMPGILNQFSKDHWFCVFKWLKGDNLTLMRASWVCRIWRRVANEFFVKSKLLEDTLRKMKIEVDVPKYMYSAKRHDYLVYNLLRFSTFLQSEIIKGFKPRETEYEFKFYEKENCHQVYIWGSSVDIFDIRFCIKYIRTRSIPKIISKFTVPVIDMKDAKLVVEHKDKYYEMNLFPAQ